MSADPLTNLDSCQRIIHNLVNRFDSMYPIDRDTLLSEAYHAYVQACAKYDPTRTGKDGKVAALTSWVYFYVYMDLKTMVMKGASAPVHHDIDDHPMPSTSHFYAPLTEDLSDDAKTIVQLFVETPGELLEMVGMSAAKNTILRCARELFIKKKLAEVESASPARAKQELFDRFQDASKEITQRLTSGKTTDEWLIEKIGLTPKGVREMCAQSC